jgi:hypothetical protein
MRAMCVFHVAKNLHEALPKSDVLKEASEEIKTDYDFLGWANSYNEYGAGLFSSPMSPVTNPSVFQPHEQLTFTGTRSGGLTYATR